MTLLPSSMPQRVLGACLYDSGTKMRRDRDHKEDARQHVLVEEGGPWISLDVGRVDEVQRKAGSVKAPCHCE